MTRIAKLNERLLERQPLTFAEFQKLLEAYGFVLKRVRGSHHTYRHRATAVRQIVQPNGKEAKDYQVAQFLDKIEAFGLTLDAP